MPFCRKKMLNFGPKTESQGGRWKSFFMCNITNDKICPFEILIADREFVF